MTTQPQAEAPRTGNRPSAATPAPAPARPWVEQRGLRLTIPTRERDLVPWLLHFARTVASDPQRYITDPQHAGELVTLAESYAAAYTAATDPATRNPATTATKDVARATATKPIRQHAQWIKAQPSITVEDKVKVGFRGHE